MAKMVWSCETNARQQNYTSLTGYNGSQVHCDVHINVGCEHQEGGGETSSTLEQHDFRFDLFFSFSFVNYFLVSF